MNEVVSKYVSQLRYVPTMAMYESMFKTAAVLADSEEFEHWRAKRTPDSALLFNESKKYSLQIDSNNLTFSTESSSQGNKIDTYMTKYSSLFLESMNVSKFVRVGVRRIGIYEIDLKYNEYVDKFYDTFYKERGRIESIVADRIEDTLFVLESIKDGYSIRVRIAPLKPEQFDEFFPIEEYTKVNKLKKETNILIDLDIYTPYREEEPADYDNALKTLHSMSMYHADTFSKLAVLLKESVK